MKRHLSMSAAVIVCSAAMPLSAQEWTRFRGENGAGIGNASIPAQWTGNDLRWKITLTGGGHSSPVLWGSRIFITTGDRQSGTRYISCINAEDGAELWKRQYTSATYRMNNDNGYASASAVVDESRVYWYWATPQISKLIALDHQGNEAWKIDLGPFVSQHGPGSSPIIFEDLVILPYDTEGRESYVLAVDRKTGSTRWKTPRRSTSATAATPCIYMAPDGTAQLILIGRTEGVTALDARSGSRLWQLGDVMIRRVVASPVVVGDLVTGNCGEGGAGHVFVAVRPGTNTRRPEIAWKITANAPYVPTPLFANGRLFLLGDNGLVSCREPATGKVIWQERLDAPFYGSFVCAGGRLYAVSRKGEVFVLSAGDEFKLLGRNALGEQAFGTPAIANGRMYVRTYSHLICIGAEQTVSR